MYDNNYVARDFLLRAGYTDVWLKQHTRHLDTVWSHVVSWNKDKPFIEKYDAQDIWNLYDGICISPKGHPVFLAIGSQFKKIKQLEQFLQNKKGIHVLMIKIVKKKVRLKEWNV